MREEYLGSGLDKGYIETYLKNIRNLDPVEITTVVNPINLADSDKIDTLVDIKKFWKIVDGCSIELQKRYGVQLTLLQPQRCYVAVPQEQEATGGFHDIRSLGYQYWYQASFAMMLSDKIISRELRTIELARNYLHDCFHHSTFRSFRRALRIPASSSSIAKHRVPEIYREQYGINFRNQEGLSYSSPELTKGSPKTINLNLLMDGVIVLVSFELLSTVVGNFVCKNDVEENVRREIFLESSFNQILLPRAYQFHTSITMPSKKFIAYWGGENFITLVLKAMISGELEEVKSFFSQQTGFIDAWEKLFRRPEFLITYRPEI